MSISDRTGIHLDDRGPLRSDGRAILIATTAIVGLWVGIDTALGDVRYSISGGEMLRYGSPDLIAGIMILSGSIAVSALLARSLLDRRHRAEVDAARSEIIEERVIEGASTAEIVADRTVEELAGRRSE